MATYGFGVPFYFIGAAALAFTPLAWLSLPHDGARNQQSSSQATRLSHTQLMSWDGVGACHLRHTPSHADASNSSEGRPQTSLRSLLMHPPIAILTVTAGIAAANLTWLDPVLAPHCQAIGFKVAAIGALFGFEAGVYGVCSPLAG